MKLVDLGEPTLFLDHVYLGCTQRVCKPNEIIIKETEMFDCFFPQYTVSPGTSRTRRRTKCEVRRNSCDVVSFKTVRRRVVQTSSQVMCDSCRRAVSAVGGCWFSDSGQSHFKQGQFIRARWY